MSISGARGLIHISVALLSNTSMHYDKGHFWTTGCSVAHVQSSKCREEKSVHYHHRKKIFWGTFLASKKNFAGRRWTPKPYETRKTISTTENFPLLPPLFSAKKSSALEQGGVCFLSPRKWLKVKERQRSHMPAWSQKSKKNKGQPHRTGLIGQDTASAESIA